jgi:hypothetical protein
MIFVSNGQIVQANHLAGAAADCTPEFIEMTHVGVSHESGAAQLLCR